MITFDHDPAVTEALKQWRSRTTFPTDLSSAELRGFSQQLKQRSVFVARGTSASFIDGIAADIDAALAGKINKAEFRLRQLKRLAQLGYDPAVGFPQDMAAIPPAERGSLRDLSSETRLNLIFETNTAMARNYSRVVSGNRPEALFLFPAWELVRLQHRDVPRGFRSGKDGALVADPAHGWPARWQAAGESARWDGASQGKMIALKDSPIWQALGDGAGDFQDTLGNPYPPFAFQSGMDWRAVARREALALDLMASNESTGEMKAQLAPDADEIKKSTDPLREDLRAELLRELKAWKVAA